MNGGFWAGILIGAVTSMITAELLDLSAWISPKLTRAAARRLPEAARDRYQEEWLAELASMDGLKLLKLCKAVSIWWGSFEMDRVLYPDTVRLTPYVKSVARVLPRLLALAWQAPGPAHLDIDGKVMPIPMSTFIAIRLAEPLVGTRGAYTVEVLERTPSSSDAGSVTLEFSSVSMHVDLRAEHSIYYAAWFTERISVCLQLLADWRNGTPLRVCPSRLSRFHLTMHRDQ